MEISGAQVRAARGLLGWTVRELARRAIVSIASVHAIEEAQRLPSNMTAKLAALQETLETAGIEFTDGDVPGVRLRARAPKRKRQHGMSERKWWRKI
jgi:transcriptional regulator with XRE-family HTH domain